MKIARFGLTLVFDMDNDKLLEFYEEIKQLVQNKGVITGPYSEHWDYVDPVDLEDALAKVDPNWKLP
jgi:hypothetical protein